MPRAPVCIIRLANSSNLLSTLPLLHFFVFFSLNSRLASVELNGRVSKYQIADKLHINAIGPSCCCVVNFFDIFISHYTSSLPRAPAVHTTFELAHFFPHWVGFFCCLHSSDSDTRVYRCVLSRSIVLTCMQRSGAFAMHKIHPCHRHDASRARELLTRIKKRFCSQFFFATHNIKGKSGRCCAVHFCISTHHVDQHPAQ